MSKKKLFILLIIVLFCMVAFCINTTFAENITVKVGHVNPPGEPAYVAWEYFAKRVDELSKGQIKVDVYPSSQLGNERDLIEGVRLGTMNMTAPSVAPMTLSDEKFNIFTLPYIFRDEDHQWKVTDGPIGKNLAKGFEEKTGIRILNWWSTGVRHMFNNKAPVWEPEDLKGKKVRIMESQVYKDLFNAIGALPTPLPYGELYSGLMTGLVDFGENDSSGYRTMKFFEVAKYFSLTGHEINCKPVLTNAKWWNELSSENQKILEQAMNEATKIQRDLFANNFDSDLKWLMEHGVRVNMVDQDAFRELMKPVWEKWEKILGKDLIQAVVDTK